MSMTPASWKITCSAAECSPDRFTRLSSPLVVEAASRAEAVRSARRAGWVPTDLLISGGNATDTWWCARHVERYRAGVVALEDSERRAEKLARFDRADRARRAAQARRAS